MMKDLKLYINPEAEEGREHRVFYSCRRGGPYYCWRYEEGLERWRSSRVLPADLSVRELSPASWKALPTTLQASLDEYYIE